jgi:hypothetical protein
MRRGWPGSTQPMGLPNMLVDTHASIDHIGQID